MSDPVKQAIDYQRALFECLEEFFFRATGRSAIEFATIGTFSDVVRAEAHTLSRRVFDALGWADKELRQIYSTKGLNAFRAAKQLGGFKLVLGGSSRFLVTQFESVRSSLLYADTVFIPDPVLPWLESGRKEERFRHVHLLQAAHALLHLKPLVDSKMAHPPILVFPSWEKSLEENDPQTKKGVFQLVTDVFAQSVDPGLASFDDVVDFVRREPDQFIEAVERHNLFVAPGGSIGGTAKETLAGYEKGVETWRSEEWLKDFHRLSPSTKILQAVIERIVPQYHILENSEELNAHPLVCVEQQAHYFKIVSQMNRVRLESLGLLDNKTIALMDGLGSRRLKWLSQIPIDALVELRENGENANFRELLNAAIGRLHESSMPNLDRIATEICLEIDHAIAKHDQTIRKIKSKYAGKHVQTAIAVAAATSAVLVPSLAPYIGPAVPFAIATKFGVDAWNSRSEKRTQTRSLMGVLVVARPDSV